MPPTSSEATLSTLFADIHYYFSPPPQTPPHDRFDKGSYVYIYEDKYTSYGRLEIANNAGTPEQDAFAAALESARITYSHKKPLFFSIAVLPNHAESSKWQLPTYDPQQQRKYMYSIYAVDLYFWTAEDAADFLAGLKRAAGRGNLDVQDAPPPQPTPVQAGQMSAVVQKLEQVAITPQHQYAHHQPYLDTRTGGLLPPPPPPSGAVPVHAQPQLQQGSFGTAEQAPMAYNPAAPAAPEPRAHREKTPPPPDAAAGTGLNGPPKNQYASQQQHYQPQYQQQQQQQQHQVPTTITSFSPPPTQQTQYHYGSSPGQSPRPTPQSFPPPPPAPPGASSHLHAQNLAAPSPQTYGGPPFHQQQQQHQQHNSVSPVGSYMSGGPVSPPLQSPSFAPPPVQPQAVQSPPPGGFSQYQYNSTSYPNQSQQPNDAYNIHQQAYKPTEAEAGGKHLGKTAAAGQTQQPGRLEAKASQVEKGVNRLFKKLDSRW